MDMWKQRTEFLLKRRRQDVQVFLQYLNGWFIWIIIQDQYEHCLATAVGKTFIAPNPEFSQRETEREARRFQNKYENNLLKSKL
jgi:hypothetical protein